MARQQYALSPQQRRLEARGDCETPAVQCELRLSGALDVERLRDALARVVARHAALRTTFCRDSDGSLCQVVCDEAQPAWRQVTSFDEPRALALRGAREADAREAARRAETSAVHATLFDPDADCVLVLTLSALRADRRSLLLLVRDLARAYRRETLSPDGPQYAEFSEWRNELLRGADAEGDGRWNDLDGASGLHTALPFERVGGPGALRAVELSLSASTREKLAESSGRLGVPVDVFVLCAFLVALARWGETAEVVIALGLHGRRFEDLNETFGPIAASVPLRTCVAGELPFAELVERVAAAAGEAGAWQEYWDWGRQADEDLVGFDHLVLPRPVDADGLRMEVVRLHGTSEARKAVLVFQEDADAAMLELVFDEARLSSQAADRLLAQVAELLRSAARAPGTRVGDLPMSPPEEVPLLDRWSRGDSQSISEEAVHELFLRWAWSEPDRLALAAGDRRLTYANVAEQAFAAASWLRAAGIEDGDPVALCLERSPELAIGQLAVLMAGGAFVALDPAQPEDRLAAMIADSRPRALLCARSQVASLARFGAPTLCLSELPLPGSSRPADLPRPVGSNDLAYVIYTSGSTGSPKGVEIEHRSLANLALWSQRAFGLTPDDRGSQLAAPGFDASIWEIWPHLVSGSSVWFAPEDARASGSRFLSWLSEARITVAFAPTPLAEALLVESWPEHRELRLLLTGGDKLRRADWGLLPVELRNCYGPTECGVVATATRVPEHVAADRLPSIGGPIDAAEIFILDDAMKRVPIGVPGELCIGGVGVGRGYRNNPGATAAAFVAHPLRPGDRVYRTGDVARFREDGQIECLGRRDDQVKIRGFRIELGEVEAALASEESLREVAVVAAGTAGEQKRLVAYLVHRYGAAETGVPELRASLSQRVPDYMVPARFVFVDALPVTANGKVDRRALVARGVPRDDCERRRDAPETPEQEMLSAIWLDILELDHVGIHDNFFELGGDSILSVRVAARARQLGLALTPRQMLEHQTIAEQAAAGARIELRERAPSESDRSHPLTPTQLWHFDLHRFDVNRYNTTVPLAATEPLAADALDAALERISAQHEALRLRFFEGAGGWRQRVVREETGSPHLRCDYSSLAPALREAALGELLDEMNGSLDVEKGPLFRVASVRQGGGSPDLVLIVAHHLAGDAVSLQLLIDELADSYRRARRDGDAGPASPGPRYTQWVGALHTAASDGRFRDELSHWLDVVPRRLPELPDDMQAPAPAGQGSPTGRLRRTGSGSAARLFSLAGERLGVRPQELLVGAVARACARFSEQRSAVLDLSVHGREPVDDDFDASRCIGWFSGVAPVRLELGPAASLADAAAEAAARIRAMPGGGLGWQALRYLAPDDGPTRELRERSTPQVCVAYLGKLQGRAAKDAPFRLADGPRHPGRNPDAPCDYRLEVLLGLVDDRIQLEVAFSARHHRRSTVERLVDSVLADLTAIAGDNSGR
jgi:amino acid adenylation domain-containing protein/non-ribosomal peptide synthase protein (TIGR01720 family)